ncbi:DUF4157 domain-containing protein [Streptomyces sp. NPDC052236]|uniref:DUF4157 domain-containing protein n=1 Tax=Streptomyces sp. NPDC052236 TaxID=3365686 RepID=UPI0037D36C92
MRDHVHDQDHENGDAAVSRPHQADDARLFKAAAGGRTDVVGMSGMGILQRAVGNSAVGAMVQRERDEEAAPEQRSPVHDVVSSGSGQALDTDTRTDLEARLGSDFSDVRVHTGDAAHQSAKSVGAHAYTVGNNVVFQRDAYDPSSQSGRTTLAHELTHVMQQRSGPVEGTDAPGGIRVSDPSDRYEQEATANAARAMSAPAPQAAPEPVVAPGPAAAVQRQSEGEDEEPADVQGMFVQRAEEQQEEQQEEPAAS